MVSESFVHACAGGAGGLVSMTLTYPLMAISTRAAVDRSKHPSETLLNAVSKVIAKEGISGLYDGLSSSLIGIGVTNFVYYFFFEGSRDFIVTSKRLTGAHVTSQLSTLESIVAGLISGTATAVISNPIWVINTRQTVRGNKQANSDAAPGTPAAPVVRRLSFLATLRNVVEKDGVLALWRGLGPALVLVTNPVLQYTVFEQIKNWVVRSRTALGRKGELLSDLDFFLLGAISKLVATSITYPQIVIKARQQALSNEMPKNERANVWSAMTDVVKDEGYALTNQSCWPLPRPVLQAAPVHPYRSHPVRIEGTHLQDHEVGA